MQAVLGMGLAGFARCPGERIVCGNERQRLVKSAHPNRLVRRSRGCDERQLESLALRARIEKLLRDVEPNCEDRWDHAQTVMQDGLERAIPR